MRGSLLEHRGAAAGPAKSPKVSGVQAPRPVRAVCGPFWRVSPIGMIRTPFPRIETVPASAAEPSSAEGLVEVFPDFEEGLGGLERCGHIWLLFVLHCKEGFDLSVRRRRTDPLTGLFSTRCPCRPNPIGITLVRFLGRSGRVLRVRGVDMVSGTPLLDIKPFAASCDVPPHGGAAGESESARPGWVGQESAGKGKGRGESRTVRREGLSSGFEQEVD